MAHAGDLKPRVQLARQESSKSSVASGVDAIVNNPAGCGAQLKEYAFHLRLICSTVAARITTPPISARLRKRRSRRFSPKPRTAAPTFAPLEKTICYDEPCHLLHAPENLRAAQARHAAHSRPEMGCAARRRHLLRRGGDGNLTEPRYVRGASSRAKSTQSNHWRRDCGDGKTRLPDSNLPMAAKRRRPLVRSPAPDGIAQRQLRPSAS